MTRALVLVLVAACGSSAPSPSPTTTAPTPTPTPTPAPSGPVANVAPPDAAPVKHPDPTCVPKDAGPGEARLTDAGLSVCYVESRPDGDADACWLVDLAGAHWKFNTYKPHATVAPAGPAIDATATEVTACTKPDTDCKKIPVSGFTVGADDSISATANADRSLVAVVLAQAIHVFDATGKKLATIKAWHTDMAPDKNDPAFFRGADFLGDVLAVRIADTPITSAVRLFNARTGKKIADVFRGEPMEDGNTAVALGGTRYAFHTFDARSIVIVDVTTGKQLGNYVVKEEPMSGTDLVAGPDGGIYGVDGRTAIHIDLKANKMTQVAAPACAQ